MKSPAGQPRARRPVQKKPVQLNLRRTPTWPEEDELDEPRGSFWKWFALVLLAHVIIVVVLLVIFHARAPKEPVEFMQVLPAGDLAKGTVGEQAAAKVAPTTPAPSHPAQSTPIPTPPTPVKPPPVQPKVQQVTPPPPKPVPPPIIKDNATEQATPIKPPPPKPAKVQPPKPKIKIDLSHLVELPTTDQPPPKVKPKVHPKKAVKHTEAKPDETASENETSGLSREEVAAKLGAKLDAAGTDKGTTTGPDGAVNSKQSDFAAYSLLIHDKVMSKWAVPNSVDATATDPIVHIHIEKSGYVPPDSVTLVHSSGNPAIDQSAIDAARSLGQLPEPLPKGFPSDTSIAFKLQQD